MNVAKPMPGRGHSAAPKFEGDSKLLNRFFEDVEQTCATHGVDDVAELIRWTIYYVAQSEEDIFKGVEDENRVTFELYKEAIRKDYPGSDDDRKYSRDDLNALVSQYQVQGVVDREAVGAFYRKYRTIASYLVKKNRLSTGDRNRLFLTGFPPDVRADMKARLTFKQPDVHPEDGYDIEHIKEAAIYAIAGMAAEDAIVQSAGQGPAHSSTSPSYPLPGSASAPVKTEPDDAAVLQMMEALRSRGFVLQPGGPAGVPGPRYQAPRGMPGVCNFCGKPGHMLRECPSVDDFMASKKLVRDPRSGMLALPDGNRFPSYIQAPTMMAKLEQYYENQRVAGGRDRDLPPHMASVNMLEESPCIDLAWYDPEAFHGSTASYTYECVDESEPDNGSLDVYANQIAELNGVLNATADKVQALQRNIDGKKTVRFEGMKIGPPPKGTPKSKPAAPSATAPVHPTGLQPRGAGGQGDYAYKLMAGVEDPRAEGDALRSVLDTQITMPLSTILSMAPNLRKTFKELCTTRRVNTNQFHEAANLLATLTALTEDLVLYEEEPEDGRELRVGKDTMALRTLRPTIGGATEAECILDPGSQIVAMRKDVWDRLGVGLDPARSTNMQSANNSIEQTLGLIRDLPFDFGGVVLHLQVHVVRNAPFEVLLGRPFFSLGSCNTEDFVKGDQYITITDPNSEASIKLPTLERKRAPRPQQGF